MGRVKARALILGIFFGEAGLEAILQPVNCCCIIPPESVKPDLSTEVRDFHSGTLAAMSRGEHQT